MEALVARGRQAAAAAAGPTQVRAAGDAPIGQRPPAPADRQRHRRSRRRPPVDRRRR